MDPEDFVVGSIVIFESLQRSRFPYQNPSDAAKEKKYL